MNILLVDDHPVVRMGFSVLLKQLDKSFVIHEAANRTEALELACLHTPTVTLLDLTFSDKVELSLIGELKAIAPDISILVVSMHDERLYAERVLRAGAKGYVMKHHAAQYIIEAVQMVMEGGIWLSDNMRAALASKSAGSSQTDSHEKLGSLSDRELEVFNLLGHGLKKAEIAGRLGLSANTIETYRGNLKQKLGIATGAELYRFAFLHVQNQVVA